MQERDNKGRFMTVYHDWMNDKAASLFTQGKSITAVCSALKIDKDTFQEWSKNKEHPFYPIARQGKIDSQTYWESRGEEGIFGDIEKFAGSSWQFVMKNRFRDSYQADNNQEKTASETLLETLLATHDLKPKE